MAVYPLPSSLDTAAATALRVELLARLDAGQPVELDGSGVARVGQACLQVLVGARLAALAQGVDFSIAAPSAALRNMTSLAHLDALLDLACENDQ